VEDIILPRLKKETETDFLYQNNREEDFYGGYKVSQHGSP